MKVYVVVRQDRTSAAKTIETIWSNRREAYNRAILLDDTIGHPNPPYKYWAEEHELLGSNIQQTKYP